MAFVPGQRWISTAEPELGLGTVLRLEGRAVQVLFATSGVVRHYAAHSAPLLRAEFRSGDTVSSNGKGFVIERVENNNGLLHYFGADGAFSEGELDDVQSVSKADERLIAGRVDRVDQFEFRLQALQRRAQAMRSPAWGLNASRVDLLPHQLRVAEVAAHRRTPRILLADEVGLGKTIEAGLIIARLIASGRTGRVLILLPETLVYQWFVEMLRRFNLQFSIFDEERCEAIELAGEGHNPFQDEQWVIAELALFTGSPKRAGQLIAAGWDLLVVDEAHHLAWSEDAISPAYALVEELAANTPGVILLTATPEQLGRSGHFARLRLLDPARYSDLVEYQREAEGFVPLSKVADKLHRAQKLNAGDLAILSERLADDADLSAQLQRMEEGDEQAASVLLDGLIDRQGTGRVMFRTRRAQVGGFPARVPKLKLFDGADVDSEQRQHLLAEFLSDIQQPAAAIALDYANDPRLPWLLHLIESDPERKLLLICRSAAKVLALEEALRTRSGVKLARFHEGLGLIQRDRNAAFFADPAGARLLLCAEIGSEGRNFQFAHTLILWDLPLDPDLLEQRIGRLDRIGQSHAIEIHAAAFGGTAQELLLRWYDRGLEAFRSSPPDGRELLKRFGDRLVALATEHARGGEERDAEMEALIAETRGAHAQLSELIQSGRDHLLELASARGAAEQLLLRALADADADTAGDEFVLSLFEQFGVENDEHAPRTHLLDPEYLSQEGFPGLKDGPQTVTFDRATALAREELPLLRDDHPMVVGAVDLLLQGEQGNSCFFVDDGLAQRSVLLECVFVLEVVAAKSLNVERFLPPTPLRAVVDSKLEPHEDYHAHPTSLLRAKDRAVEPMRYRKHLNAMVPPMRKRADELAKVTAQVLIDEALVAAEQTLGADIARLTALKAVNPGVRREEIQMLEDELRDLRLALPTALLRLDAVRFVCSPDFLGMR